MQAQIQILILGRFIVSTPCTDHVLKWNLVPPAVHTENYKFSLLNTVLI